VFPGIIAATPDIEMSSYCDGVGIQETAKCRDVVKTSYTDLAVANLIVYFPYPKQIRLDERAIYCNKKQRQSLFLVLPSDIDELDYLGNLARLRYGAPTPREVCDTKIPWVTMTDASPT
jgi:hypothetical protein